MTENSGRFDPDATEVFDPVRAEDIDKTMLQSVADTAQDNPQGSKRHKRVVWPLIVLAAVLLLAAVCGGGFWFFQSHALPGTQLWGNSMMGQSKAQIVATIDNQVKNTAVPVTYDGKSDQFTLSDLGVDIDSASIADQVMNAKRDEAWWMQYLPWQVTNITPDVSTSVADGTVIDDAFGIAQGDNEPVDAQVTLNDDKNGFDVIEMKLGKGADAEPVAEQALIALKSLGSTQPQDVAITLKDTKPAVTNDIANQAKATLDNLVNAKIAITVSDHDIATFDAPAIAAVMSINPNQQAPLGEGETRNGYVVFDARKMQDYYNASIKPNLKTQPEDREIIVNGNGDEIGVNVEGHDGVTLDQGADTNVGSQAVEALAEGSGSVQVKGKVEPMKTKTIKRHVVVDLSDHKVYAYENDKIVKTMWAGVGRGNDPVTGECTGDLCTMPGDYTIWLKYESQDMTGNLTLSDGSNEAWDAKNVGYVNYFSHTGCAIHRIATSGYYGDANIAGGLNTSHGCVGIGWDVAPWFYDWCKMGTTVHVQV